VSIDTRVDVLLTVLQKSVNNPRITHTIFLKCNTRTQTGCRCLFYIQLIVILITIIITIITIIIIIILILIIRIIEICIKLYSIYYSNTNNFIFRWLHIHNNV